MKIFIDSDLEDQYGEQLYQEHLEKENNQMKKDITTMNEEIKRLNNIINKATKYIEEESWFSYKDDEEILDRIPIEKLKNILKGKDKE